MSIHYSTLRSASAVNKPVANARTKISNIYCYSIQQQRTYQKKSAAYISSSSIQQQRTYQHTAAAAAAAYISSSIYQQ
jgi:hypothetical protein